MKKAIIAVISLCMAASAWSCGQLDQNSSSDIEPPAYLKGEQSPQPELQDSQSDLPADDVQTQPVTEQQETSEATSQTEKISPVPSSTGFPYGLWWANDGSGDSYYFFSDDNCSGSLHSQQTGTGLGFDYEIYGNTAIFHLGAADNSTEAMVEWSDSHNCILHWEDGRDETLVYYDAVDYDDFFHYTSEELSELAAVFYEKNTGTAPDYTESTIGAGGLIVIDVYSGGEWAETYSLDRFTASGTDSSGTPVKLG